MASPTVDFGKDLKFLKRILREIAKHSNISKDGIIALARAMSEAKSRTEAATASLMKEGGVLEDVAKKTLKLAESIDKKSKALERNQKEQLDLIKRDKEWLAQQREMKQAQEIDIINWKKRGKAIRDSAKVQLKIGKLIADLKEEGLTVKQVAGWQNLRTKAIKGSEVALHLLNRRVKESIKLSKTSTQVINSQKRSFQELGFAMIGVSKNGLLATRSARNVGGAFSVLRSKLLLGAFAFSMVERSVVSLAKAYGVQKEAENKVAQAILATGGAANLSGNQIKQYARDLQSVTTFGDEAILSSSALLLTFKRIKDEAFLPAQKAILDVSAAMGTDLKSSTIQIGKALNDPIKGLAALNRVGIQFTEIQKKKIQKALLATNSTLEAQKVILSELNSQFGGMAGILAMSTIGSIDQMKNAFGDMAEVAGKALAPNIIELTQNMKVFFENIDPDSLKQFLFLTTSLAGGLMMHGTAMKVATSVMNGYNSQLKLSIVLTNTFKKALLKTGILALLVGLGYVIEKFIAWKFAINEGFSGLNEKLEETTRLLEMEYNSALLDSFNAGSKFADMTESEMRAEVEKLNPKLIEQAQYLKTLISRYEGLSNLTPEIQSKIAGLREEFDKNSLAQQRQAVMSMIGIQNHKEAIIAIDNNVKALQKFGVTYDELDPISQKVINSLSEQAYAHEVLMNGIKATNLEARNEITLLQEKKDAYSQFYAETLDATASFFEAQNSMLLDNEIKKLQADKTDIDESRKSDQQKKRDKETIDKQIEDLEKKHHNRSLIIKGAALTAEYFMNKAKADTAAASAIALVNLKYAAMIGGPAIAQVEISAMQTQNAIASALAKASLAIGLAGLVGQKMEQGGLIGGRRHSQGGTIIEAEQGEFVMSRSAVQSVGIENLNRMNEGGGGSAVTVNVSGNLLSSDYVEGELAEAIREATRRGTDFGIK